MPGKPGLDVTQFPEQGRFIGRKVLVCFSHDTSRTVAGEIVRDDVEEPGFTIIKLDDGRHVLADECFYSIQ